MQTKHVLIALFLLGSMPMAQAQTPTNPADFRGANTTKSAYQVVYQLNNDEDGKIKATLKNIQNALDDPRLKGKLTVELVVHGAGVALFQKDKPYEELVKNLQNRGVILAMCENTLRERKISRDALFPFISYVPSGNGELIIRQQQGWAYMHP
ncbi:DsrE family protein [Fibrella sp. HMF5335]|uniref:DsrE family protein n=1 Tax=Fibrella rubiginis TaxID=2817060 RepID=A0A939K5C0_9BACT|nr:DsrE family protein [Fibrella rubiginis]MBO0939324.1 DsrE family protein [Fibrella rubiginis]